jgi:hypothetical protein
MAFNKDQVFDKVSQAAFGKPLITKVFRGLVVEAIIALALEPDWIWCSADYASWDFERPDGLKLEVKQSAAKQSWHDQIVKSVPRPSFDIAPRKGRWEGSTYVPGDGRNADIKASAFHPRTDEVADHRDPEQWDFYLLRAGKLPVGQKRISLSVVKSFTTQLSFADLRSGLENL